MKSRFLKPLSAALIALPFLLSSCGEDTPVPTIDFSYQADGHTVTFAATATDADTYSWDFGDGTDASTDMNPVHIYEAAGDYQVTCSVTGPGGDNTVTKTVTVPVTDIDNLAGTWKMDDKENMLAYTVAITDTMVIPAGTFQAMGMGDIFDKEFTFNLDSTIIIDNKNGMAFGAITQAAITLQLFTPEAIEGAIKDGIMNLPYDPKEEEFVADFGVCTFQYATPAIDGKWELSTDDLEINGPENTPITFQGKHLSFSDGFYFGMYNYYGETHVMIKELSKDKLVVQIFLNAALDVSTITWTTHIYEITFTRPS